MLGIHCITCILLAEVPVEHNEIV